MEKVEDGRGYGDRTLLSYVDEHTIIFPNPILVVEFSTS
jgi:hypothetical protein